MLNNAPKYKDTLGITAIKILNVAESNTLKRLEKKKKIQEILLEYRQFVNSSKDTVIEKYKKDSESLAIIKSLLK